MFKQFTTKSRHCQTSQKQNKKSQRILDQCEKVIKELQTQLQYALQQNQQKDQIVKLLTQEKQYYEKQSRKSDQKIYPKLKEQLNFNQSLINGLKQHNKELTEKNIVLDEQNKCLWDKCKQKDEILKITQESIINLQQQKFKLEREWSKILKCVKTKIFQIQHQNNNCNKVIVEKDIDKKRALSRHEDKYSAGMNDQKRKKSINLASKQKNNDKVHGILKQINHKLLDYDFLQLIQSKDVKNEVKNFDTWQQNKQNINQNVLFGKFNKNQLKNKKVPILKLGQLELKDN